MAPLVEEEAERSLGAYYRLTRDCPGWRILWIGEIMNNLGAWFGYVGTLLVVESLAEGKGILLSVVLIMRFLPSFLLFPIAGVCADRYDKVKILITSCLISAVAVALLPLVTRPQELWLLYALLFLEFSTSAFYDPARRALTPALVPRRSLHLATTLDSFAWSLMGAIGSSLGGLVASKIGVRACFLLDALTYLVAAACAYKLKFGGLIMIRLIDGPYRLKLAEKGGAGRLKSKTIMSTSQVKEAATATGMALNDEDSEAGIAKDRLVATASGQLVAAPNLATQVSELELQTQLSGALNDTQQLAHGSGLLLSNAVSSEARQPLEAGIRGQRLDDFANEDEESAALLGKRQDSGSKASVADRSKHGVSETAPEGCIALLLWSLRDEIGALKEGWLYAAHKDNRDVLALTLLKSSGSLVWAAADVLNVRFSELPEMQSLGDAAFTLGLFFASVGFACFLGPICFNFVTPPKPPHLLLSSALCFLFLLAGYIGIVVSRNVYAMCASIMVRSFGSSVMWVYSTLLLQLRVPDQLLGRMLALEMAYLTVSESASGLFGGVALDDLGLNVRQVGLIMAAVASTMAAVWLPYAVLKYRRAVSKPATTAPLFP